MGWAWVGVYLHPPPLPHRLPVLSPLDQGSLDRATTFHLISSHGRMEELLFYSELIKDYERVVGHHMQKGDYEAALGVLCQKEVRRHGCIFLAQ